MQLLLTTQEKRIAELLEENAQLLRAKIQRDKLFVYARQLEKEKIEWKEKEIVYQEEIARYSRLVESLAACCAQYRVALRETLNPTVEEKSIVVP